MTVEEVLNRVEDLCKERGWSHYALSRETKLPTSSVYNMFKRRTYPKFETLEKVCAAFQITLGEFFSPEDRRGDLTAEDIEILEIYHTLPKKERLRLKAYAEGLSDRSENKDRK